jgi:hypothetical protein
MWRIVSSNLYSIFTFILFLLETVIISLLVIFFLLSDFADRTQLLLQFLTICLVLTGIVNVILVIYTLMFVVITDRADARRQRQQNEWMTIWLQLLNSPDPDETLNQRVTPVAMEALLELKRVLRGTEEGQLDQWIQELNMESYWLRRLRRFYSVTTRIQALEVLAQIGTPASYTQIARQYDAFVPEIRAAAFRTGITLVERLPANEHNSAIRELVNVLLERNTPIYVIEDVCIAAGVVRPRLIEVLLHHRYRTDGIIRLALIMIGDYQILDQFVNVPRYLLHYNPKVRAAALRAIARIGFVPPGTMDLVLWRTQDTETIVRMQSIMALRLFPLEKVKERLLDLLLDSSWEVRFAAGEALLQYGEPGLELLRETATHHPQELARTLAMNLLNVNERIKLSVSNEWIWASV